MYQSPFIGKIYYSIILLISIIFLTVFSSCNKNGQNNENVQCVEELLYTSEFVRLGSEYSLSDLDDIFVGEWKNNFFREFIGKIPWSFNEWDLIEKSYFFEGNKLDFSVKYKRIGNGDTIQNTLVTEVKFSDDFEWIESYKSDANYTWTFNDSYANTHIELTDIPFAACANSLHYRLPLDKKWWGYDVDLKQDNIKSFTSSGKYYYYVQDAISEWDISGLKISKRHRISFDVYIYSSE